MPRHVSVLLVGYFLASLAHFAHNAEYIAVYPNLPAWITHETVWLAWSAVTSVGLAGLLAMRVGQGTIGPVLLAGYGSLGLAGLLHYTLALCAQHTFVTNLTIWAESGLGAVLMLACLFVLWERGRSRSELPDA